jgi:S-adenosylmethionine:tRNA-ribosyltransferase-isomerase (queuine synthetase)
MATTYEPIAKTTLGSAQATVTFNSITSSFTDLILIITPAATAGNPDINIQLNSDTATNYSVTSMSGNGTTATSTRASTQSSIKINQTATINGTLGNSTYIINLNNYSNSTTYKTVLSRSNRSGSGVDASAGLWRSTSVINTIDVKASSSTFLTGSTFTLYGILAA